MDSGEMKAGIEEIVDEARDNDLPYDALISNLLALMETAYTQGVSDMADEALDKLKQHNTNNKRHVANLCIGDFKKFIEES